MEKKMYRLLISMALCLLFFVSHVHGAQEELLVSVPQKADKVIYQTMADGKLLISATDGQENPIMGLGAGDFTIRQGSKTAKILSADPLATTKDIGLNIVLVVDNSLSMKLREAVSPLLEALESFFDTVRPIDNIVCVVFDDKETVQVDGRDLHAKVIKTSDKEQLRALMAESLDDGLTENTYLYDAMVVGLEQVRQMPEKSNKFMVVFSDGQDLKSSVKRPDVETAAAGIANFSAYAVDYMPTKTSNRFLKRFTDSNGGRIWKAASASELLPIFESFTSTLLHRYVVAYRFLSAPSGSLAFDTSQLTIEEITTIDSAPLLNYLFFDTGQSELSQRYTLFKNRSDTDGFAEKDLKGAMQKYRHVLNIIGKRLRANSDATIRIVGCNADMGEEKGRLDLSRSRAEAASAYLHYVWGIEKQRMVIKARNLPEVPSTNRIPAGRVENQRVEIYSDHPAILDTVNSEYVQKVCDQGQLKITPQVQSEAGVAHWKVNLNCGPATIQTFEGQGDLPAEMILPLNDAILEQMVASDGIQSSIQITDKEGNVLNAENSTSLPIRFVRRQEQMAQKQGYKVVEQYALILFDYDSAAIKAHNQVIVDRIIKRMKEKTSAAISILGHTDNIGTEAYNLKLSEKRAGAVKDQVIKSAQGLSQNLHTQGLGPNAPLYDNNAPEGRALNRTVTVSLEYLQN